MSRKFFGIDGVCGCVNIYFMIVEMVLCFGVVVGCYFCRKGEDCYCVVIGKDMWLLGYMLENVLMVGLISIGMNVLLLGFVLMFVVGFLICLMWVDVGIMILVSYNLVVDNGIKFFGLDGFKLFDEVEVEIEVIVVSEIEFVQLQNIGCVCCIDDGCGCYVEYVKIIFLVG